jgi:hypothetical protein
MELHEKVAQEIVKDISGRYEEYDTIERLENFLKNLEDLGIREVHQQLVGMLRVGRDDLPPHPTDINDYWPASRPTSK